MRGKEIFVSLRCALKQPNLGVADLPPQDLDEEVRDVVLATKKTFRLELPFHWALDEIQVEKLTVRYVFACVLETPLRLVNRGDGDAYLWRRFCAHPSCLEGAVAEVFRNLGSHLLMALMIVDESILPHLLWHRFRPIDHEAAVDERCHLLSLPPEMKNKIFQHLSFGDLYRLSHVCECLNDFVTDFPQQLSHISVLESGLPKDFLDQHLDKGSASLDISLEEMSFATLYVDSMLALANKMPMLEEINVFGLGKSVSGLNFVFSLIQELKEVRALRISDFQLPLAKLLRLLHQARFYQKALLEVKGCRVTIKSLWRALRQLRELEKCKVTFINQLSKPLSVRKPAKSSKDMVVGFLWEQLPGEEESRITLTVQPTATHSRRCSSI